MGELSVDVGYAVLDEGYAAQRRGVLKLHNPYYGTDKASTWQLGWEESLSDRKNLFV